MKSLQLKESVGDWADTTKFRRGWPNTTAHSVDSAHQAWSCRCTGERALTTVSNISQFLPTSYTIHHSSSQDLIQYIIVPPNILQLYWIHHSSFQHLIQGRRWQPRSFDWFFAHYMINSCILVFYLFYSRVVVLFQSAARETHTFGSGGGRQLRRKHLSLHRLVKLIYS